MRKGKMYYKAKIRGQISEIYDVIDRIPEHHLTDEQLNLMLRALESVQHAVKFLEFVKRN